jgi:hypothetical protein
MGYGGGMEQTPLSVKEIVKVRLLLAQDLLETCEQYDHEEYFEEVRFKRHSWESLVMYLLLTCFDKLGQSRKNPTSYQQWLLHIKKTMSMDSINLDVAEKSNPVDISLAFYEKYLSENSVKFNFYKGINKVPTKKKENLLKSLRIWQLKENSKTGDVEWISEKDIDGVDLDDIKMHCLYELRNDFTHNLDQCNGISQPTSPDFKMRFMATIAGNGFKYAGYLQKKIKRGGNDYMVDFYGLIFILFESIYAAIDEKFDVTDIDVRFNLFPYLFKGRGISNIPHKELSGAAMNFSKHLLVSSPDNCFDLTVPWVNL